MINTHKQRNTRLNKTHKYGGNNNFKFVNACEKGKLYLAKDIYEKNPNINDFNEAFTLACKHGHLHIANWLLQVKPNIKINQTTFTETCIGGHLEVVQWLLRIKPNIKINNLSFGFTCGNGHLEVAQWLLQTNPKIDITDDDNFAFLNACSNGHLEVAQWLYSQNIFDVNDEDNHNTYIDVFQKACRYGFVNVAQWLLQVKPFNINNVEYETAFKKACVNHHIDVALMFVEMDPLKYVVKYNVNTGRVEKYKVHNVTNKEKVLLPMAAANVLNKVDANIIADIDEYMSSATSSEGSRYPDDSDNSDNSDNSSD